MVYSNNTQQRGNKMSLPKFEYDLNAMIVTVQVTSLTGGTPANLSGNPDYWTPAEPLEAEYEIVGLDAGDEQWPDDFWAEYLEDGFDLLEYLGEDIFEDIEYWVKHYAGDE